MSQEEMEGAITTAGNLKLFVPKGYDVTTGSNTGDPDENQIWLHTMPPGFTNYYWFILQDSETTIDSNISLTKSMNEGTDLEAFTVNGIEWKGVNYMYGDISCNMIKGVKEGLLLQATIVGHDVHSDEVVKILSSLEKV